ncbi:S8 family serine peptidase [Mangrovicoccus algicola]|uniref:S8 family serine peptidase n=1 Tax=Mangrovicoccus algicola TaxID=2771008 RepID=A0A8J6Z0N9_9RHOB|nr:S8 family serine peptidase [Mangrovicoccus algicola]MBE3640459.1 S8 family serine peptidase [Mangrovicoccus algicola]
MSFSIRLALALSTCLAALAGCAPPGVTPSATQAPSAAGAAPEIVDDRQLLVLTAGAPAPLIARAEALGYVLQRTDALAGIDETLISLRIPAGRTIPQAIAEIEALEPGVTAGANHAFRLQQAAAASPGTGRDFAGAMIGWPAAGCAAARQVGLIDAGIGAQSGLLASGAVQQRRFRASEAPPATDHGTLMAELLIGEGRLSRGRLLSADVVDPDRGAGDVAGVDAILRAVDWMAQSGVDLVNVSLAGPYNKLIDRGLGKAASEGMVLVAAAGNSGPASPPRYPAALPFVLAVTAVDRDAEVYPMAVHGSYLDLAAPGVDIVVRSGGRMRILSGTSAAAPYVTAAIAADPALGQGVPVAAVRRHLARAATDLGPRGKDDIFGAGLVHAPAGCRS